MKKEIILFILSIGFGLYVTINEYHISNIEDQLTLLDELTSKMDDSYPFIDTETAEKFGFENVDFDKMKLSFKERIQNYSSDQSEYSIKTTATLGLFGTFIGFCIIIVSAYSLYCVRKINNLIGITFIAFYIVLIFLRPLLLFLDTSTKTNTMTLPYASINIGMLVLSFIIGYAWLFILFGENKTKTTHNKG